MSYYITKSTKGDFDAVVSKVIEKLKDEGFGVLTEIDVANTLKQKLGVEMKRYRILGACNPGFAHKALSVEDKIGVMLPCNVVVQEKARWRGRRRGHRSPHGHAAASAIPRLPKYPGQSPSDLRGLSSAI